MFMIGMFLFRLGGRGSRPHPTVLNWWLTTPKIPKVFQGGDFFFSFLFIYFWLCCVFTEVWASSSCREQGLLCCSTQASHCSGFSCCKAQALGGGSFSQVQHLGFSSCGTWAQQLQFRDPCVQPQQLWHTGLAAPSHGDPGPGIQPASPALAGRFFTTQPPALGWGLQMAWFHLT